MRGVKRGYTRDCSVTIAVLIGLLSFTTEPAAAGPMADANKDGTVNGQDLLAWQANLFNTGKNTPGDFNQDGIVNGSDLLMWQSQLYMSAPPAPPQNTAANPEPISFTLSLLGLGGISLAIRRRDRAHPAPIAAV